MKKVFTAIVLACFALTAVGQEHLKIKNIPISGTVQSFKAKLRATGLQNNPIIPDGSVLKGSFAGMPDCNFIFGGSAQTNTVFRVAVLTDSYKSWEQLKSKYESLVDSYSKKYQQNDQVHYFSSPYKEGDGDEIQALCNEKCIYLTVFDAPGGTIAIEIKGMVNEGRIMITYEDEQNFKKAKAENEKVVSDDI